MIAFVFAAGFFSGAFLAAVLVGFWLIKKKDQHFEHLMAQARAQGTGR